MGQPLSGEKLMTGERLARHEDRSDTSRIGFGEFSSEPDEQLWGAVLGISSPLPLSSP